MGVVFGCEFGKGLVLVLPRDGDGVDGTDVPAPGEVGFPGAREVCAKSVAQAASDKKQRIGE